MVKSESDTKQKFMKLFESKVDNSTREGCESKKLVMP